MNVVLLGAPGAGKGTQARRLAEHLGLPPISTGDLLRAARSARSSLGQKAEKFMAEGKLVPDDLVIDLIRERLSGKDCLGGYILDGFPRTLRQAEVLDQNLLQNGAKIDRVVNLDVDPTELVKRLSGRRQCRGCGENFHVSFHPPKREGICDRCGGALFQREDDREEVIRKRLEVYQKETKPLVEYYRRKGNLKDVTGTGGLEEVFAAIVQALK